MWRAKLSGFWRLPWAEKSLVFEALAWLGVMRLAVRALPFQRVTAWLGQAGQVTPEQPLPPGQEKMAIRVAHAIRRIQPFTPWDSNCLAQALTARQMLLRRGIPCTTYLGAFLQGQDGLVAHAWLRSGPWILTGGEQYKRYAVVATFASFDRNNP